MWLSVIDGTFYYFSSNLSSTPLQVLGSSQFEDVSASENDEELYFDVYFKTFTLRHSVRSLELKRMWVKLLRQIRMDSYDLLSKLGIIKEHTLKEEISKARGGLADSNVSNISYLDDKKLDNGKQIALIAVAGKSKVNVVLVEPIYNSLRSDCAFVLDMGQNIYHWNGPTCSRMARARAMGVTGRLRKDRGSRPKIHLVEEDIQKFLGLLGLGKKIKFTPAACKTEMVSIPSFQIFKVIDTTVRKRRLMLVYEGNCPSKEKLESENVYILSASPGEVFIWNGSKSKPGDRTLANVVARRLSNQMLDAWIENCIGEVWITVLRVFEHSEYACWKEKFVDYPGSMPISMRIDSEVKGNIAQKVEQTPIEITKLLTAARCRY
jgi:hypothetical protein